MSELVQCPRCGGWRSRSLKEHRTHCQLCGNNRTVTPELSAAYRLLFENGHPSPETAEKLWKSFTNSAIAYEIANQ